MPVDKIPEHLLNKVTTGDHNVVQEELPDESVELIYTDPPYPKEFLHVFYELGRYAGRVLVPGGSLITLCGQWEVPYVIEALSQSLQYHWTGWVVHGQKPTLFGFRVVNGGKPLLWFCKGRVNLDYGFWWDTKFFRGGGDKRFHKWGQPENYCIQDIELLTKEGDVVLEPFTGGGTVPAACKITRRNFVAFELDPATADTARQRIAATNPPLFIMKPVQIGLPQWAPEPEVVKDEEYPLQEDEYAEEDYATEAEEE